MFINVLNISIEELFIKENKFFFIGIDVVWDVCDL